MHTRLEQLKETEPVTSATERKSLSMLIVENLSCPAQDLKSSYISLYKTARKMSKGQ